MKNTIKRCKNVKLSILTASLTFFFFFHCLCFCLYSCDKMYYLPCLTKNKQTIKDSSVKFYNFWPVGESRPFWPDTGPIFDISKRLDPVYIHIANQCLWRITQMLFIFFWLTLILFNLWVQDGINIWSSCLDPDLVWTRPDPDPQHYRNFNLASFKIRKKWNGIIKNT